MDRYNDLAAALDEMALHLELEGNSVLARKYQLAGSTLKTTEFIPPDPSSLDGVDRSVRDAIAEWRAFGEIERLEQLRDKHPYLSELTQISKVGPKRAKQIYDETGATDISDIRQLADEERLEEISGIGPKTATTIRRSIAQL